MRLVYLIGLLVFGATLIVLLIDNMLVQTGMIVYNPRTVCSNTVSTSPEAPNHVHRWCTGAGDTEQVCNAQGLCHKHKINEAQNIAEPAGLGPHTHKLY